MSKLRQKITLYLAKWAAVNYWAHRLQCLCQHNFVKPFSFSIIYFHLMWKMIQMQHEKWWSKNLASDLVHLSDSTQKEKLCYLFTALATLLSFIPMLLPGVSNCQSFPVSSARLKALQAAPSPSPLLLSKLGKWQVLPLCPESYQMLFSQRSGRLRQEMQFKGKKENPGNILWLHHPSYITKKPKFFWETLGWYLLHPAAPVQEALSPWQWWEQYTSKNNPWRFRGRMKNCAGARTRERTQVTKPMATRTCPNELGGPVGHLRGYFPTAAASQLVCGDALGGHWLQPEGGW